MDTLSNSYLLFSSKADIIFSLIKDNFLIYFSLKTSSDPAEIGQLKKFNGNKLEQIRLP